MPLRAILALLAACLFWAVSFIATKVALEVTPPLTVVMLRMLISALCFALWLVWRGRRALGSARPHLAALMGLSLLGTGLHYALQTIGLQYTSASNASLFAVTGPITIAILGALMLGERLGPAKVIGILVALVGVLVVMGADTLLSFELGSHALGDVLVLASIVMWGMFTVFGKKITDSLGAPLLTAVVTVMGAIYMVPLGAAEMWTRGFSLARITVDAWLAIAFLGVMCSFLATLLYFIALQRTESQKVGVFLYTIPPMTAVAAHFALGESLGWGFFVGSVLVLGGVFLTERG